MAAVWCVIAQGEGYVPGCGVAQWRHLRKAGVKSVVQLMGKFLLLDRDPVKFKEWLTKVDVDKCAKPFPFFGTRFIFCDCALTFRYTLCRAYHDDILDGLLAKAELIYEA